MKEAGEESIEDVIRAVVGPEPTGDLRRDLIAAMAAIKETIRLSELRRSMVVSAMRDEYHRQRVRGVRNPEFSWRDIYEETGTKQTTARRWGDRVDKDSGAISNE